MDIEKELDNLIEKLKADGSRDADVVRAIILTTAGAYLSGDIELLLSTMRQFTEDAVKRMSSPAH